jgi:hypothetical protein
VIVARTTAVLLMAAVSASVLLAPSRAPAQWWRSAPADFEECADIAEKAATREDKAAALAECNSKFAGRRKPGGGYTYYDFMQNRNFDIAGPNPTPAEQKLIDEQYTAFLDRERQSNIAAAFAAKQLQLQQASLKADAGKPPAVTGSIGKPPTPPLPTPDLRPRAHSSECARHSFSCEWPRISEGIKDLKKLFSSSSKPKRS